MSLPARWGGEHHSLQYEPYIRRTPGEAPISLVGHGMDSVAPENTEPLTVQTVKKVNGRIRRVLKTLLAAEAQAMTFNLLYGDTVWTPIMEIARRGQDCAVKFYGVRLCPEDPTYEHCFIYDETRVGSPSRVNAFITIGDSVVADWQSECRSDPERLLWALGAFRQKDYTPPLYAVAFLSEECEGCGQNTLYSDLIAVGGAGGVADEPYVIITNNRFGTETAVDIGVAVENVGTSVFTDGPVILVGFADEIGLAAATGGVAFNESSGSGTWVIDTGITEAVRGITKLGQYYIAVGGTGGGQAMLWYSTDGQNWTSLVSAELPATDAAISVGRDLEAGEFYVGGENGLFLRGRESAGSLVLSAITLPNAAAVDIRSIFSPEYKTLVVGGSGGYCAISYDGGLTWAQKSVIGTADVYVVGGPDRLMAGSGTNIQRADIFTKDKFKTQSPEGGVTLVGDITGFAYGEGSDSNYFAFVTDEGEAYVCTPHTPGA